MRGFTEPSTAAHNRKGWLFSDTVADANVSANLYSLVQTCKANGIDSYRYLRALFVTLTQCHHRRPLRGAAPLAHRDTGT